MNIMHFLLVFTEKLPTQGRNKTVLTSQTYIQYGNVHNSQMQIWAQIFFWKAFSLTLD